MAGNDGTISAGRARRRTAKAVDYAKEQEFSDVDVFEDSADETPVAAAPKRVKARRRKVADSEEVDDSYFKESKPIYTERGYDPNLPSIRERFTFLPEYEPDGSPRIELIVGRRPVDEKENVDGNDEEEKEDSEDDEEEEEEESVKKTRRGRPPKKKEKEKKATQSDPKDAITNAPVEYEYLVKYKNRSYLHLEWKTGADLESMNKSAKSLYRRYLKKVTSGTADDDIEDPNFDPSFAIPQKIVDEAEQELTIELTDRELIEWEKEREKALAEEEEGLSEEEGEMEVEEVENAVKDEGDKENENVTNQENSKENTKDDLDWEDEDLDFSNLTLEKLRKIVDADGPYYGKYEGSNNPYRDGYVTEPPKKPRASYLFFQCTMRSYFQKRNANATQGELMTILGDTWKMMGEAEQAPFIQLAREESARYDKERVLMEKAQRPNEVWQPMRRCGMVLDRISKDGFANIFLEPVNTAEFTDYEEVIDQPMDLGTVKKKLDNRKYQAPEQFARDVRKIWNNCKIYNQHGSAIWHVADYMSKVFERLYHAWVLEFRERYLRWVHTKARPWEPTCRQCDGKCDTPDDQMVLCDHCDALYGLKCLKPPLKKLPTGVWHCADCKPKLHSLKGIRMLSAVAEQAARKRAELGDTPKKRIRQTMYLIKWLGLGYEFCTWETREDVNADALIQEYRRLNTDSADEPDMPGEAIDKLLDETKHVHNENAGGSSCIPDLRSQLYAQTRAIQFTKFGMNIPMPLSDVCGPKTYTCVSNHANKSSVKAIHPKEVVECVSQLVQFVACRDTVEPFQNNEKLPPLLTGEYDTVIPITSKGLMMNVGEIHGYVAFLGYRTFPDGSKGPAELSNLIRNVGDKIIAVDGVSTVKKSFKEVIMMLRESGKHKFAFMRFLENKYSVCDNELGSVGNTGRYATEELKKKFMTERQRLLVERKQLLLEEKPIEQNEESDESVTPQTVSKDESDGSEGEFEPDSDEEDPTAKLALNSNFPIPTNTAIENGISGPQAIPVPSITQENGHSNSATDKGKTVSEVRNERNRQDDNLKLSNSIVKPKESSQKINLRQETTRSLAYRVLDIDLGVSSDEGGDEDCAFVFDGVDESFTALHEANGSFSNDSKDASKVRNKDIAEEELTVPVKRNDFSQLGERSKLAAAVALAKSPPLAEDFEIFPLQAKKEIETEGQEGSGTEEVGDGEMSSKSQKLSNVKIEQVSTATNEVIHVWPSAEVAAATLQLPLNEIKRVIRGDYDEDLGDEVGGFRWRYALAGARVTAGGDTSGRGKKAKEAWLEFRDKLYDPSEPHSYKNGNRLRDYQVDGVNWLASTWYRRHGCILADEMGLGKTVQIVCYIEHLFRVEKIQRPYIVVVPLSTVEHWRREFEGWTDMVCCVYHDRQRVWRDVLREYEWYYADRPHTPEFLKFDVLVTTYDTLIGDFDVISQVPFRAAVVDEAHRLRNQKGKLLECMREISARGTLQYGYQSRVLMSGTPLQNDLNELWTLLNFIEPFKFPDLNDFQKNFGNMANRAQVEALQQMISPFMLRRVKEDVAKDIPSKEETVIDVELTSIQKQYYRAIFEHNHAFLSMGATRQNAPKLMNIQMELRKVCNHPFLLEGVEHRETDKQFKEFQESGKFEGKTPEEQHLMLNEHGYIMTSGKMVLLDKLLPKLRQEGHKVLIFSQMVKMLDFISEYCEFRSFPYERLDGRVRGTERQKAIDRFEREDNSFIFLLSTRAGGVGINLTAADICIIFDSDWNPQNDVQAQARCHRIGQTRDVRIYRLITSRTFEQEMFDRASKKLGLEQAVLGTFDQGNEDDKPTNKEMEQLLKKGAYALLEDENDEIGKAFCADDIENILAKRTRTRVVEGAKTASWLNKQGMVVSKSKFTSDSTSANLDMDDPNFWQKVMPDFVTPTIMLQKLDELSGDIVGTPKKGPGRGRGRGRKKKSDVASPEKKIAEPVAEQMDEDEEVEEEDLTATKESKYQLTRTNQRKVHKFMSDLKSMMEGILEEAEDETLPALEKSTCQKLLLTISLNEKLFNEQQRHVARSMLKKLEGDRRRRCRTSDQPSRFSPGKALREEEEEVDVIPEELRIVGRKQRKKRRKKEEILNESGRKQRKRDADENGRGYLGEDGYLHHSDSEADWSDVGNELYQNNKKKNCISRKEAKRRRQWAADDDPATAAGRPWPAFPRSVVGKVLGTLIEEVMKRDEEKGGVFSVPVPRDEFPEYYDQIKQPMDYGTMKEKLEKGEYRSAQAMQKDFILVMQNCLTFNSPNSDIVKDARQQALMRPKILREAAIKHKLFLAEDGSVLEIVDEDAEKKERKEGKQKRRRRRKGEDKSDANDEQDNIPIPRKRKGKTKKLEDTPKKAEDSDEFEDGEIEEDGTRVENDDADSTPQSSLKKKPRIRIRFGQNGTEQDVESNSGKDRKNKKRSSKRKTKVKEEDDNGSADDEATPIPKRKRRKVDMSSTSKASEKGSARIKRRRNKMPVSDSANKDSDREGTEESDHPSDGVDEDGDQHRSLVDKDGDSSTQLEKDEGDADSDKSEDAQDSLYMNLSFWKKEREALDGSFAAARARFTKRGQWILPSTINDSKFKAIAKATLKKMDGHDKYQVFTEAVTESEAPGYSDIIKNPMDFGTMREKVDKKAYGTGSDAAARFYKDFLLVFDNCRLYNDEDGDVVEEAARLLGLLPECYVASCTGAAAGKKKQKF